VSIFDKIFGATLKPILDTVFNVVDELSLSDEEKATTKLALQTKILEHEKVMEETLQVEMTAKAEVMKAELAQGDNYTKRARPTVIYGGLVLAAAQLAFALPWFRTEGVDPAVLPAQFWVPWAGIVGTYAIGRTMEKKGVSNAFTKIVTGS
jgi:hypothetical protein